MSAHVLTDAFLRWLGRYPGASFVEIERWLADQGVDPAGSWALEPVRNLVVWAGVSKEFCDFFHAVRSHVHLRPLNGLETIVVYAQDGKMLDLPLAKRPPPSGYKDPHWVPCVINLKPDEEHAQ